MPLSGVRISWLTIARKRGFGAICSFGLVACEAQRMLRLDPDRETSRPTL
jgi:hypothetical protein